MAYIEFNNVCLEDGILKNINFEIEKGELVAIIGPSNYGKTEVLNILGGNIKPSGGKVKVDNILVNELNKRKILKYRRKSVSISSEDDLMLKNLTTYENIKLGSVLSKNPLDINEMLKKLNLLKKKDCFYNELSLSEQKKVVILRSLVKNTDIFLGDKIIDTFELKDKKQILKMLKSLCKKDNKTVIITTDNDDLTEFANRVIKFKNKNLTDIIINKKPKAIGDLKC